MAEHGAVNKRIYALPVVSATREKHRATGQSTKHWVIRPFKPDPLQDGQGPPKRTCFKIQLNWTPPCNMDNNDLRIIGAS